MIRDLELTIERMGQAGDGIGRLSDGRLAFIPGGLPGEQVTVRVTEEKKHFVRADVLSRRTDSIERIEPVCPIYEACGGCVFQHWEYGAESRYKEQRVRDALKRIAHLDDATVAAIRPSTEPYSYRNKGQFPVGGTPGHAVVGLYRRGTHDLIGAPHCDIQDPLINRVLAVAESLINDEGIPPYDEGTQEGILRHLLVRSSQYDQGLLVLLIVTRNDPRLTHLARVLLEAVPEIRGVGVNINADHTNRILGRVTEVLAGSELITESILGLQFRLSFTSFFQVNPHQVEVLYRTALDFLPDQVGEVWDLYSGVGTLAALASERAGHVRALEQHPKAVADAKENLHLNHIQNVEISVGRVEDTITSWIDEGKTPPDAVIVDPPRRGLEPRVIQDLLALGPSRIIYISCNPDTWARDVASLQETYALTCAVPVDMFPRTDHVEVASVLTRRG